MSENGVTGHAERQSHGCRVAARMGAAIVLLLASAGPMVGAGAALGRDERRAERISGDDDPIRIPRSEVPRSSEPSALNLAALDPDTTGSVGPPARRARPHCTMLAWF